MVPVSLVTVTNNLTWFMFLVVQMMIGACKRNKKLIKEEVQPVLQDMAGLCSLNSLYLPKYLQKKVPNYKALGDQITIMQEILRLRQVYSRIF